MKYNKLYDFYDSITKLILRTVKNSNTKLPLSLIIDQINKIVIPDEILEELINLILDITNWSKNYFFSKLRVIYNSRTIKGLIKEVKKYNSTYDILVSPYSIFIFITFETIKYLHFFNDNRYLIKPINLLSDLIKYKHIRT